MPELPEVETVASGVNERTRGDRIRSVWLSRYKEPFKNPPTEMAEALTGQRIERVHRVGKHIVFDLGESSAHPASTQWIVHLGMTGRLLVSAADIPLPPHTHAVLSLTSGRELRRPAIPRTRPRTPDHLHRRLPRPLSQPQAPHQGHLAQPEAAPRRR